ncbi:sigma-54 dependent transcriptional regulator [Variovorax sp. 770b2]|uniref:sigma-54-dependent transcriptional regulator n=1 Tax=Variovorax sp. 770b2 TaxID=1566271 RepID=UPI0008F1F52F|nr:sigma-54 dependent transcriptional regulator [Variovorax sp. 770b2]SFP31705.1 DNA-binding transcriptional response regulator, NtrC family, contains REC, AAA-type ATPase, and a Fis-type DNA-binding domains [Variovorax sp. 770b2]
MGHALIVEDDEESARMIAALVVREGHTAACAHSIGAARRLIATRRPDLLLLDLHLRDGSGFDLLADLDTLGDTVLVLMSAQAIPETSTGPPGLQATDYLPKPINPQQLKKLLSRLVEPSQLRLELDEVQERWRGTGRFGHLIGRSPPMQRVYRQMSRVADTAVSVFVHGESGTGKELVARGVHDLSGRRDQPFLAVNCAALSPHLIESEIFGHERGSFSGAEHQYRGFFERAHGGTLFLDEVTEMPLELQAKLLRVLESGIFMRVGSVQLQQTDVRIIAATNRDAAQAVTSGKLREDLLYRLHVFPIGLPPLRERGDDIQLIARSFLQDLHHADGGAERFSPAALSRLSAYHWPGNVRELRNIVQRTWVMATGPEVGDEWLPPPTVAAVAPAGAARALPRRDASTARATMAGFDDTVPGALEPGGNELLVEVGTQLADVERRVILATYESCGRNKERTAAVLGISMKTLYNRLKEYRL